MGARRPDRRVRQGRVQPRPARDRVPLRRGAHHLRPARHLQDRRQGDRRPGGHVAHLHGEVRRARGQLLPHPPLAARRGRRAGAAPATRPGRHVRRSCEHFLAGQLAALRDFTLLYAPNINSYKRFQPGSFAPDRRRLGPRQPHLRAAGRRPRPRPCGCENRLPGGDVNPYLAVAGMIAAGLYGIEHELELARGVHRQRLHRRRRRTSPPPCARPPSCGRTARSPGPPSATRSSTTTATWPASSWTPTTPPSPTGSASAPSNACEEPPCR